MREWLIAVILFAIAYWIVPQKYHGWVYLGLVLEFALIAFRCVPAPTDDLSRYFKQVDRLRAGGWSTLQAMIDSNTSDWGALPVCGYYFYLVSLLPSNSYLPAITIFIVYGSMFYLIYRVSRKFEINKWYVFLGCMFTLTTYWYYDVCSGVRNGIAFTTFILFVFLDVVENKKIIAFIGYFLCAGLHSSTILFLFLRGALEILKRYESKWVSWVTLFGFPIGANVMQIICQNSDNKYLSVLAEKLDHNLGREFETDKTYIWVNTTVIVVVLLFSYYLFDYINKKDVYKETFAQYGKFYTMILFFTVGSFFSQLIFVRIVRWVIPIMGGMFFMIGMQSARDVQDETEKANENPNSVIRKKSSTFDMNELIITVLFVGYTAVHLWYTCNGSSLIWLHFA